jgi:serine phosphatase RsbU (regulator of sigma subunit)
MKKNFNFLKRVLLIFALLTQLQTEAQSDFSIKDSLLKIENTKDKTEKAKIYFNMAFKQVSSNSDTALLFLNKAEILAKEINDQTLLERIYWAIAFTENTFTSNYTSALYHAFDYLMYRKINVQKSDFKANMKDAFYGQNPFNNNYFLLAYIYANLGNKAKSEEYLKRIDTELLDPNSSLNKVLDDGTRSRLTEIANVHILNDNLEEAKKLIPISMKINLKYPYLKQWGYPYIIDGNLNLKLKNYEIAINDYKKALPIQLYTNRIKSAIEAAFGMADAYQKLNLLDSSLKYCNLVIEFSKSYNYSKGILNTYYILAKIYNSKGDDKLAYHFLDAAKNINDSLYSRNNIYEAQNFALNEQEKNDALDEQKKKSKQLLAIIGCLFILSIVIIVLIQKSVQKRKFSKIEEARKNNELLAAKNLQLGFLPKNLPQREDIDIATHIQTSTEVGGDYYDFITTSNNALLSICGDATGHGVASGIMVSVTKASLYTITESKTDLILKKLNEVVKNIDLGTLRMSLNIVEINENKISMSSAAMPPVYLFKASTGKVEEIKQSNLPLGGLKNENYDTIEKNFESGDVFMQLTDGLPEAPNPKNEMYDYHRVQNHLESVGTKSAEAIKNSFILEADKWLGGNNNPDDITFIIIKKK